MSKLVLIVLFSLSTAFAQDKDAVFWGGIGVKYDINKKIGLKYETQVRLFKNASTISSYYNEFSGGYKITKHWDAGINFRYSLRNQEPNFTTEKRIALNLSHDIKIKDLGLKVKTRGRYQFDYDRLSVINDVIFPNLDHTFRLKSAFSYENDAFKRLQPYVGGELFFPLNDIQAPPLSQYRVFAGVEIDLPKRHEIELKYIFQHSLDGIRERSYIYMIQYNYELKFNKKK